MTDIATWNPKDDQPVTFTAAAVAHIKKEITKRGKGVGVYFGVKKMGCSGLGYVIEVIDQANTEHNVYTINPGLIVTIDQKSLPYLLGTEIDYVREGLNSQFKFNNPNEKASCGCGESFTVE